MRFLRLIRDQDYAGNCLGGLRKTTNSAQWSSDPFSISWYKFFSVFWRRKPVHNANWQTKPRNNEYEWCSSDEPCVSRSGEYLLLCTALLCTVTPWSLVDSYQALQTPLVCPPEIRFYRLAITSSVIRTTCQVIQWQWGRQSINA